MCGMQCASTSVMILQTFLPIDLHSMFIVGVINRTMPRDLAELSAEPKGVDLAAGICAAVVGACRSCACIRLCQIRCITAPGVALHQKVMRVRQMTCRRRCPDIVVVMATTAASCTAILHFILCAQPSTTCTATAHDSSFCEACSRNAVAIVDL